MSYVMLLQLLKVLERPSIEHNPCPAKTGVIGSLHTVNGQQGNP